MNEKTDFFVELKFTQYDRLNSVPETALLMEAEFWAKADKTTINDRDTQASEKGIIFALGFIATLLLSSGVLLHRSLNVTPVKSETTDLHKASVFDTNTFPTATPVKESNRLSNRQLINSSTSNIEFLAHKNAIAHGRF